MSYKASMACAGAFAAVATLAGIGPASAHTVIGQRIFPATLTIDDPGVDDELALPTFAWTNNADGSQSFNFNGFYGKRITSDLEVSINSTLTHQINPRLTGWGGIDTEVKDQIMVNTEHEFVVSVGVAETWGGTGNQSVGAPQFTVITPKIFIGKGFGDLGTDWLRPFAITGELDYSVSTHPIDVTGVDAFGNVLISQTPTVLAWGATLQYSLLYLNSYVHEVEGPEFLRHLIPTVEAQFFTPVSNIGPSVVGSIVGTHETTGSVNPGVFYIAHDYEIGVEAVFPINNASGKHPGVLAIMDFFLDDIFPNSLGKPIFGGPDSKAFDPWHAFQ